MMHLGQSDCVLLPHAIFLPQVERNQRPIWQEEASHNAVNPRTGTVLHGEIPTLVLRGSGSALQLRRASYLPILQSFSVAGAGGVDGAGAGGGAAAPARDGGRVRRTGGRPAGRQRGVACLPRPEARPLSARWRHGAGSHTTPHIHPLLPLLHSTPMPILFHLNFTDAGCLTASVAVSIS